MPKVFPFPNDLPTGSLPFARETIARIEGIEQSQASSLSDQNATNKSVAGTLNSLGEQVYDLQSRVTVVVNGNTYATPNIPNTEVWQEYSSERMKASIINLPEGKDILVSIGCGQATLSLGSPYTGSMVAGMIAYVWSYPDMTYMSQLAETRLYNSLSNNLIGAPMSVQKAFKLPPGQYYVEGRLQGWAATTSGGAATIQFIDPYMTLQVVTDS